MEILKKNLESFLMYGVGFHGMNYILSSTSCKGLLVGYNPRRERKDKKVTPKRG